MRCQFSRRSLAEYRGFQLGLQHREDLLLAARTAQSPEHDLQTRTELHKRREALLRRAYLANGVGEEVGNRRLAAFVQTSHCKALSEHKTV